MMESQLPMFKSGKIGIEREMLRNDCDGHLAMTEHPAALGHVLTHPNITIDYAESLIEVVTDPINGPEKVYQQLLELHQYCAQNIGDERLWPASMPCILPKDAKDIKIGYFGQSNAAKIKTLYRKGLGLRYGKPMQMIAGVHFNYSPHEDVWQYLSERDGLPLNQDYINNRYMSMLRGIQRYSWLICYLFGASPAADMSFTPGLSVLDRFDDTTLGWAFANTLRMSKLGYQNKSEFTVSFNNLKEYNHDLVAAVKTHSPNFEYLRLKDKNGEYQQISTNILQIENEYYTAARPKQITKAGELPSRALYERGIAYVELRLLDVNPLDPCGISKEQLFFLEVFMLWTLSNHTAEFTNCDYNELTHNRLGVACCGRMTDYQILRQGKKITAKDWSIEILHAMLPIAHALDKGSSTHSYSASVHQIIDDLSSDNQKLSNKIYNAVKTYGFVDWGLRQQMDHAATLSHPLSATAQQHWKRLAQVSLQEFEDLSVVQEVPFDQYLAHYFDSLAGI